MKLNPSCIRDILIAVESHSDFNTQAEIKLRIHFLSFLVTPMKKSFIIFASVKNPD